MRTRVSIVVVLLCLAAVAAEVGAQSLPTARMPLPFGVGVSYFSQKQPYDIVELKLGLPGWNPAAAKDLKVDNDTTSSHVALDYWVLPFLNVFVLGGKIDGTTTVKVSELNLGLPLSNIRVDYDGWMYGGGVTLAGGWDRIFVTASGYYTSTSLDATDSTVRAFVASPKVGYTFSRTAVYVGAMYQDVEERHKGSYAVQGLGVVPFDVTLQQKEPWNYLAGVNIGLAEHWVLNMEAGFGERDTLLANLMYRF